MKIVEAIAFGLWVQGLGFVPSVDRIRVEYPGISRQTAWRWRRDLLQAMGRAGARALGESPRQAHGLSRDEVPYFEAAAA